jgi:hypothetical protein
MNNPNAVDNLNPFEKGQSGNPNGRPKGKRNRATVARQWLEVVQNMKNPLTSQFEDLEQQDLMTLALIKKAREGDVAAYKALMDSGYGMPTQSVEVEQKTPIFTGIDLRVQNEDE